MQIRAINFQRAGFYDRLRSMYIRHAFGSHKKADGSRYESFRIEESVRINGKPTKLTLLTIGSTFDLDRSLWKPLCRRIEEIVYGRPTLFESHPEVEKYALEFSRKILKKRSIEVAKASESDPDRYADGVDLEESDGIDSLSTGGEHVALHGAQLLGLPEIFRDIGFTESQVAMALVSIVARMLNPGSESATWEWLTQQSAIGELLEVDLSKKSVMRLHRVSDELVRHRHQIESALFSRIRTLFSLEETILLFDLTNTYFEGEMEKNEQAKRGHSKEKRSDAPLLTLGLVVDGSGFVRRSQVFAGNVSEASTVQDMLGGLSAPEGALVVMDRGTATQEVLDWLVSCNYHYVVVSREKVRTFDMDKAQTILTAQGHELKIYSEPIKAKSETRLYCYSPGRYAKEHAITESFIQKFEDALTKMHEGLSKPRTDKKKENILKRIGRLQEQSKGISQHYVITVSDNAATKAPDKPLLATAIHVEKKPVEGSRLTHPGVYCLRSNVFGFTDEALWKIYVMLTDLEAVFRSLKTELGLRPVYHQTGERCQGHLFISVLAYQCVQAIRTRLKACGIYKSWNTIRAEMAGQVRATLTYSLRNGGAVHVRKALAAKSHHKVIYDALNISHRPGKITRARFNE